MNKGFITSAVILVLSGALMVAMSPDPVSLLFVGVMCVIVVLGLIMGILPCTNFCQNFKAARKSIRRIAGASSNDPWLVLQQSPELFRYPKLSGLFKEYMNKANRQHSRGEIISDVDTVINEDSLSLYCWQGACLQIPGTLTGIGLLGTFLGLIMGISNIGFSSVDAALSSVETLLSGIELAFYSSIAGVILSILYNLIYKLTWNITVREMNLFLLDFHMHIMPSMQEQNLLFQRRSVEAILDKLDRLPRGVAEAATGESESRQAIVQKVQEAIHNGEFCFYLQPRCNLLNREIIGSEALIRWNNPELGLLGPSAFMDVIEKNGFIARLDQYIWEEIFKTIREWLDSGVRPLPIGVNISGTDILAFDVPAFFAGMLEKYKIPPRYLEIEISESSYLKHGRLILEAEAALRAQGLRVIMDSFDGDFLSIGTTGANPDAFKLSVGETKESIAQIFTHARTQHLTLIANRIESMAQLTELRRAGCTEGQGFVLHAPVSVGEFLELTSRAKTGKISMPQQFQGK
ncbi:MAG: EAL domain-containing protein [Clostridia bacterium]|nr:EAL domain-containing protein [Clostridia bacterium]